MTDASKATIEPSELPDRSATAASQENALLKRQIGDLALLLRITNVLHRSLDAEEIVRILLTAVTAGSALGFNRAILLRIDQAGQELVGWAGVGPLSGEEASRIWNQLSDRQSFEHAVALATGMSSLEEGEFYRRVRELRFPLTAENSVLADVVRDGEATRVADARNDSRLPAALRELLNSNSLVVAPLAAGGRQIGALVADNRFSGKAIWDEDVELLESLARHAGLAIERARVHERTTRQLEERARLHEISKGILATIELDKELELIAQYSAALIGADWSTVWLYRESAESVRVAATFGAGAAALAAEDRGRAGGGARRAIQGGRPVVEEITVGEQLGSFLCVPLFALDHPVGAVAVFSSADPRHLAATRFSEDDQEILALLGDQAAIAIHNARLVQRIRRTEKRLREAEAMRLRSESLAALGEMSAKVSHEIRTPLAAIGGFARVLMPHFAEASNERRAADIIISEVERLERLLTTQLDFARLPKPRLQLCDLNEIVSAVLALVVEEAARGRVRILHEAAEKIPRLLLDPDHIKQVILNLIQNGIEWLPEGGRLRVVTRRLAAHVAFEVATDGEPIAGEMLDRLFVPFSTARRGGSGLGLAVAHQIVREHGGQIRARSEGEWGAIFTVILPLRGNEDRRGGGERRQRLGDRRQVADLDSQASTASEVKPNHG